MLRTFLTGATDFAKEFNKAVEKELAAGGENPGLKSVRETVEGGGGSLINLLITVGVIVAAIALIIAGMKLASRNGKTRQEGKEKLVAVVIGSAAIMAIGTILLIVQWAARDFMK